MDIETVDEEGRKLSLRSDLSKILQILREKGYLLLCSATKVEPVSGHFLSFIKKDIVVNQAVKTVLFSARSDSNKGFCIPACRAFKGALERERFGRDPNWKELAAAEGFVGSMCYHLGGGAEVTWIVPIIPDVGQEFDIRARGGDIFICQHWLLRSKPYLAAEQERDTYQVVISYLWMGCYKGDRDPLTGDKILEECGGECSLEDNCVVWKA